MESQCHHVRTTIPSTQEECKLHLIPPGMVASLIISTCQINKIVFTLLFVDFSMAVRQLLYCTPVALVSALSVTYLTLR
jgi:hypothetical protein